MLIAHVEASCPAYPDGSIPHGHLDVEVHGRDFTDYFHVEDFIRGHVRYDCGMNDGELAHLNVSFEDRQEPFVHGPLTVKVVDGDGDLLDRYPVGTEFK